MAKYFKNGAKNMISCKIFAFKFELKFQVKKMSQAKKNISLFDQFKLVYSPK